MSRASLVLVPGMLCDDRLFAFQAEALSAVADVWVARIDEHDTVAGLARQVLADCPFGRFRLAGLSMGGIVAMEMLRQSPERIAALALLDTNHRAELPQRQARRQGEIDRARAGELPGMLRQELAPLYLAAARREDTELLDLVVAMGTQLGPDVFARQSLALRDRPDSAATLSRFRRPALVLCGAEDRLCPVSRHEEMAALMPRSRLVVIEGAGHLPPLETPSRVANELRLLLEE